ncbi:hypothetical protein [Alteromonas sp. ASW11-130]|uniref:hypothetical protein n=1 Tax=Alteromonas sp. ASW11-130 TaxID=3015775 RepID=UPI0022423E54|nr:hypothetical protein [Alteromonas sp. ASW11-130]MCW8093159.1 hypothetical protein [Alteromonas sp. ASW11-130]
MRSLFLPKFKGIIERYSLGINFFLTLIATLVGVLLAISITNYEDKKKEKKDVIKLLSSSISSVETCHEYTKILIEYFEELPDENVSKADFYAKNPPPYPAYLDTLLMQNIVSKNLSGAALSDLNELLINLKRSRDNNATLYLKVLEQTLNLLKLEISFQKEIIDETQLSKKMNEINTLLIRGESSQSLERRLNSMPASDPI